MPCIYCGTDENLTVSDIIPDALTNRRITNKFVCKKHNNPFGETFEYDVIKALAPITNDLCIKSSKSKHYQGFDRKLSIDGNEYKTKSSLPLFYESSVLISEDGKQKLGDLDTLIKIQHARGGTIKEFAAEDIECKEKISVNRHIFNSLSMHRLIAKIGFEWYCKWNNIDNHLKIFDPLIKFIISDDGSISDPVTARTDLDLYKFIRAINGIGDDVLIGYLGEDGSVNITISLLGIAIYNVKLLDTPLEEYKNNSIFQIITLDGVENHFAFENVKDVCSDFNKNKREKILPKGQIIITCSCQNYKDQEKFKNEYYYLALYGMLQKTNDMRSHFEEKSFALIDEGLNEVFNSLIVTLQCLKRFVAERKQYIEKGITLVGNPVKGANRETFLFFWLFVCGEYYTEINSFRDLSILFHNKYAGLNQLDQAVFDECLKTMLDCRNYSDLIKIGAEKIEKMQVGDSAV